MAEHGEILDSSGSLKSMLRKIFQPTSIEELKNILVDNPGTFTTLDSLQQSSSDLLENLESIIDMKNMPSIFSMSEDLSTFTASTNMMIRDVLINLSTVNMGLPATGTSDRQTIGGLLGAGTAPPSKDVSIFSVLRSVRIISVEGDGDNQKAVDQVVKRGDPMFKAMVANLGVVGVLVEATFEMVWNQYYHTIQELVNINHLLEQQTFVDKSGVEYPFWKVSWFPRTTSLGSIWAARPIQEIPKPFGDYPRGFGTKILKANAFENHKSPFLSPTLNALYDDAVLNFEENHTVAEGPMRNMLPIDRFIEMEMNCVSAGFSFLPEFGVRVKEIYRKYFQRHSWSNLPVEIYLTKVDEYFMSHWNFQKIDPNVRHLVNFNLQYLVPSSLDANQTLEFREQIVDHVRGLWNELVKKQIPFKAEFGKLNFTSPEDVGQLYMWDEFKCYVCKKFLNPYLIQRWPPLSS